MRPARVFFRTPSHKPGLARIGSALLRKCAPAGSSAPKALRDNAIKVSKTCHFIPILCRKPPKLAIPRMEDKRPTSVVLSTKEVPFRLPPAPIRAQAIKLFDDSLGCIQTLPSNGQCSHKLRHPDMNQPPDIIPPATIALLIRPIRGQRVILDADLAGLYGVPTFRFNEAVKRNLARFPEDFMFRLNKEEWTELQSLRSQNAMLKPGRGQHRKYAPCAFTEHG